MISKEREAEIRALRRMDDVITEWPDSAADAVRDLLAIIDDERGRVERAEASATEQARIAVHESLCRIQAEGARSEAQAALVGLREAATEYARATDMGGGTPLARALSATDTALAAQVRSRVRVDERAYLVGLLNARSVTEQITADRGRERAFCMLDTFAHEKHEHAVMVLDEIAKALMEETT